MKRCLPTQKKKAKANEPVAVSSSVPHRKDMGRGIQKL